MKRFLAVLILISILALTFALAGCSGGSGKTLQAIQDAGKLVVYTDPNFPPFELHGPDGKPVGVDMEIAQAIADEIGVELVIQEAEFDTIIAAVKSGKGDLSLTGMTITDERKKSIDFSIPYINSIQYLILPEDSEIAVMQDLAGKKVGVALGYTGQYVMEDETGMNDEYTEGVLVDAGTELLEYNSALEATLDMKSGRIDAVVMDEYVSKSIVASNDGIKTIELKYADGNILSEEYGVVVPKNSNELLETVDKVVKRLVDEGKIAEWVVQYSE